MKTKRETRSRKQDVPRQPAFTKLGLKVITLSLAASVFLPLSIVRAATVYAVAGKDATTSLFGTLDIATGQFTKVAETTSAFFAISVGPDHTLYGEDFQSGKLFTISASGATAEFGSVHVLAIGLNGLAYSESGSHFFSTETVSTGVSLHSITGDGNSDTFLGELIGQVPAALPNGNLAFGGDEKLYFNYSTDAENGTNSQLYTVNPANGALTAVGGGLGTRVLALFSDGETLYGVDNYANENIGVYAIDTISGKAKRVSTVTGLPSDNSYQINAAAALADTTAPAVPTVSVSTSDTVLPEGGAKGNVVFKRSGDTTAALTIKFKLSGVATNGVDYGTGSGKALGTSITIPAGATKAKLKIFALVDGVTEGKEKLAVKLTASPAGNYTIGSPAKVKISITDGP